MNVLSLSTAAPAEQGLLSGRYWDELRIFAEVARSRSFNETAKRLGISQPTIGRKVKRLQDVLGTRLVVPSRRGIALTRRGEELAAALLVFDRSLFSITNDLRSEGDDAGGMVSLSVTDGLAAFFVAPAIPALAARYPRIQLHLKTVVSLNDLRPNQSDMMLTFTPSAQPDVVCRRLGSLHFLPVAAKAYTRRHGVPTRDTIVQHPLLQSHLYCTGGAVWDEWQALCAKGRIAHHCDNSFAYGMMVKEGLGIGLLGAYAARERSLVPLELGVHAALPLYAIALADRMEKRSVQLVFEWLGEIFGPTNPWFDYKLDLSRYPENLPALSLMFDA